MKRGSNVVHYTLELNEAYVGLRYDICFTGIANQNLKYHKDHSELRMIGTQGFDITKMVKE